MASRCRDISLPQKPKSSTVNGEIETRTFKWKLDRISGSLDFVIHVNISVENVKWCRNNNPFKNGSYPENLEDTAKFLVYRGEQFSEVETVAYELANLARTMNLTEYEEIQNILSFVQEIPYRTDMESIDKLNNQPLEVKEYWRFPIETLYDVNGDCDCKAILAATLFRLMDFKVILLLLSNPDIEYAAVAIKGAPDQFNFFEYKGEKYYLCEMMGREFKIAEQPSPEFAGQYNIIEL